MGYNAEGGDLALLGDAIGYEFEGGGFVFAGLEELEREWGDGVVIRVGGGVIVAVALHGALGEAVREGRDRWDG